jgi:hypothetical protein
MSYLLQGLFGERSLTKVAGLFAQQSQAESSLDQVIRTGGLNAAQVRLLGPQDARMVRRELFGRAMEPESAGIARTFLQSHLVGGMAGAVAGLALYYWFYRGGHPMIASSPLVAFIAIVGFATTFGLLAGGLLTLRPDHVRWITHVRSALRHNQWAVVAHPINPQQTERVRQVLEQNAAEVVTTL